MILRRLMIALPFALLLGGCGGLPRIGIGLFQDQPETKLPYRANLTPLTRGAREFTVTVNAPGTSLAQFRESARFPATRYCLRRFGSSDAAWAGIDSGWAVRYTDRGRPVVAGRCTGR